MPKSFVGTGYCGTNQNTMEFSELGAPLRKIKKIIERQVNLFI